MEKRLKHLSQFLPFSDSDKGTKEVCKWNVNEMKFYDTRNFAFGSAEIMEIFEHPTLLGSLITLG